MSTSPRWPIWLAIAVSVPAAFVVAVALITPSTVTPQDVAREETARCLRAKGGGAWRASSGITLDAFCRAHPERC